MSIRDAAQKDIEYLRDLSKKLYDGKKFTDTVISMDDMTKLMRVSSHPNLFIHMGYIGKDEIGYCVSGVSGGYPDIAGELRTVLTILDRQIPEEWDRSGLRVSANLPSTLQRLEVLAEDKRRRQRERDTDLDCYFFPEE